MSDVIDQALICTEQFLEAILAEHRKRKSTGRSRTHCEDCQQPIPDDRRKAAKGCTRCVTCQEAVEIHAHWRAL